MKSLFLFFILVGGWSIEGSVGVVRGPGRRRGPWDLASVFSDYPSKATSVPQTPQTNYSQYSSPVEAVNLIV